MVFRCKNWVSVAQRPSANMFSTSKIVYINTLRTWSSLHTQRDTVRADSLLAMKHSNVQQLWRSIMRSLQHTLLWCSISLGGVHRWLGRVFTSRGFKPNNDMIVRLSGAFVSAGRGSERPTEGPSWIKEAPCALMNYAQGESRRHGKSHILSPSDDMSHQ